MTEYMQEFLERCGHAIRTDAFEKRLSVIAAVVQEILSEMQLDADITPYFLAFHSRELHDMLNQEDQTNDAETLRHILQALIHAYVEEKGNHPEQDEAEEALANLVRAKASLPAGSNPFSLAVGSHFTCYACELVFTYKNAARHVCQTRTLVKPKRQAWMTDDYYSMVYQWFLKKSPCRFYCVWSQDVFHRHLERSIEVLNACGFKYKLHTTTVEDVDAECHRFMCLNHQRTSKYIPIMNWMTAVGALPTHSTP